MSGRPAPSPEALLPLLPPSGGRPVAVALSGGSDSVALLGLLRAGLGSGQALLALHVDHRARAPESCAAEVSFVDGLCQDLGVPLRRAPLAAGLGAGEDLLRRERYRALSAMGREAGCAWVALAHHRDDQVETFFLRLLRGTDLQGLRGMPARFEREGQAFVRPLLGFSRADLAAWREAAGLACFEDPSNADTRYRRNLLRRSVLSILDEVEPGWRGRVGDLAGSIGEHVAWMEDAEASVLDGHHWRETGPGEAAFPREPLRDLGRPLLRRWVRRHLETWAGGGGDLTRGHVDDLTDFILSQTRGFHPRLFPGQVQVRGRQREVVVRRLADGPCDRFTFHNEEPLDGSGPPV